MDSRLTTKGYRMSILANEDGLKDYLNSFDPPEPKNYLYTVTDGHFEQIAGMLESGQFLMVRNNDGKPVYTTVTPKMIYYHGDKDSEA